MRTREQEVWYQVRDCFIALYNIGVIDHECDYGFLGTGTTYEYIPDAELSDKGSFQHEDMIINYSFSKCSEGFLELNYELEY